MAVVYSLTLAISLSPLALTSKTNYNNIYESSKGGGFYQKIADYVNMVLCVSAAVNKDLYKEIKKEGVMTDAIKEIFEKEFEEERENTKISIVKNMLEGKEPVEKIVRYTNVPLEKIIAIAKKMGISSLTL